VDILTLLFALRAIVARTALGHFPETTCRTTFRLLLAERVHGRPDFATILDNSGYDFLSRATVVRATPEMRAVWRMEWPSKSRDTTRDLEESGIGLIGENQLATTLRKRGIYILNLAGNCSRVRAKTNPKQKGAFLRKRDK
jgi:hypothetical protein